MQITFESVRKAAGITAAENANGTNAKRQRKGEVKLPLSDDEKAAFYAKMVKADGYLPQSVISNTIRDTMPFTAPLADAGVQG